MTFFSYNNTNSFSLGVHAAFCYFHLLLGLQVHLCDNLTNTDIAITELK